MSFQASWWTGEETVKAGNAYLSPPGLQLHLHLELYFFLNFLFWDGFWLTEKLVNINKSLINININ